MGRLTKSHCPHGKERTGTGLVFCSICNGHKPERVRTGMFDGKGRPKKDSGRRWGR